MNTRSRLASLVIVTLLANGFSANASAATVEDVTVIEETRILSPFADGQDRTAIIVQLRQQMHKAFDTRDWKNADRRKALHIENTGAAEKVLSRMPKGGHRKQHTFYNFPGFAAEVSSETLTALMADPDVLAIEPNSEVEMHSDRQALPLMNALASRPQFSGKGVSVAVVDTGVDYKHPRLGGGSFPNSKVIGGYDVGDGDADPAPSNVSYNTGHGTHAAGIVAGMVGEQGDYIGGVAPDAKIYALKITQSSSVKQSARDADIIAAWDWAVSHQYDDPANPILVVNTSFGGGRYTSACDEVSSAYMSAVNNGRAAGITFFVSSGNTGYCDAISEPACLSGVISVGGVYDADSGGFSGYCVSSDSCLPAHPTLDCGTAGWKAVGAAYGRDKVTEFSNSATFLTLLAPANDATTLDIAGAAGYTPGDYTSYFGGTSAAAPYAAGAAAAVQSAAMEKFGRYLTPDEVTQALVKSGKQTVDSRNGISKPRVDVGAAIQSLGDFEKPANDDIAAATPIVESSGLVAGHNIGATEEAGEFPHAGQAAQKSVWWNYVPSRDGEMTVTTENSNFDTRLAVYVGDSPDKLTPMDANDNAPDGQAWSIVRLDVEAGKIYWFAVDGINGASGHIGLRYDFEVSTCFLSAATSNWSTVDLAGEMVRTPKLTRKVGGVSLLKGTLTVRQINVGENGRHSTGMPSHSISFYLSDGPQVPCEFDSPPVGIYSVAAGRLGKSGKPAKPARVKFKLPMAEAVAGKYLVAVLDEENKVLELDKKNNALVIGPLQ